jgi:hypothetical protein
MRSFDNFLPVFLLLTFIQFKNFFSKVWFQNRRMKDKRQKMTLSWPCGDPVLAAYVLQAAAASGQLPYPGMWPILPKTL